MSKIYNDRKNVMVTGKMLLNGQYDLEWGFSSLFFVAEVNAWNSGISFKFRGSMFLNFLSAFKYTQ